MWVHRVHGVQLKQARGVLLGPLFAYGFGRVGELGVALYLAVIAVAYWKALPSFEAAAPSPEVQHVIRALADEEEGRSETASE